MTRNKKQFRPLTCLLGGGILLAATFVGTVGLASELTPDDCIKCHDQAPADISSNGGAHKSEITCVDCHEGHPPKVLEIIPACSKCHEGQDHFTLDNCLGCHTNPHTPLVITLPEDISKPCLTCHTEQMDQLRTHESAHTSVACTTCHREKHGFIPACADCHSPHIKGQEQKDCLGCHKPHMPLEVTYSDNTPSTACAACHDDANKQLSSNPAKHSLLNCAACHQQKHKAIPKCQSCHGETPHAPAMHVKFPQCGQCHGIAHNLNK